MVMFPSPQQAFPEPMPFPRMQPDPQLWGLSPYDQMSPGSLYLPPSVTLSPSPMPGPGSSMASALELPGPDDAGADDMSWEEAQARTDRAIARIASVNPELAQQLMAQKGEQLQQDNRSLFSKILGTVASSPLGKALEIVTRPFRILPEVLTDTDESVWKNIGDALSGRSTATMADFLKKYIIKGDDTFSRWARGILGFGLDIAVDPLTYVTGGLAALGRISVQKAGAKLAAKAVMQTEGMSVLDYVARTVGRKGLQLADDAPIDVVRAAAFEHMWTTAVGQRASLARLGKWGSIADDYHMIHPDAVGGWMGGMLGDTQRQIWFNAIKSGEEAAKIIGKFGLQRLGPRYAAHVGIPLDDMRSLISGMQKTGRFATREAYIKARLATALEGGLRMAFPWPFRLITPAIWGTKRMDFSILRRFFSGLSGQYRIMRAVESGALAPELGRRALEAATIGGWREVKEKVPQVAHLFGGVRGDLGSAFASASWQIGGITRPFGSFMVSRGGGLGAILAADARKTFRTHKRRVMAEILSLARGDQFEPELFDDLVALQAKLDVVGDVSKRGNGVMTQIEVQRTMHQLERMAKQVTGDQYAVVKYLEAFPDRISRILGADQYYDVLEAEARRSAAFHGWSEARLDAELTHLSNRRLLAREMQQVAASHPEVQLAARLYRTAAARAHQIYNEAGGHAANATVRIESEAVINPANREVVETGHAVQHGKTYQLLNGTDIEDGHYGFLPEHVSDSDYGRGYVFEDVMDETPPAPREAPEAPPGVPEPGAPAPPPSELIGPTPVTGAAGPGGWSVDEGGLVKLDRFGAPKGQIPVEEIEWVRTEDLMQMRRLPRTESAVEGSSMEDYARQIGESKRFSKYVEVTVDDGVPAVTDGNHTLEAANAAGAEWTPIWPIKAPPADMPLVERTKWPPQWIGGSLRDAAPDHLPTTIGPREAAAEAGEEAAARLAATTPEGIGRVTIAGRMPGWVQQIALESRLGPDRWDILARFAEVEVMDPKWAKWREIIRSQVLGEAPLDVFDSEVWGKQLAEYWEAKMQYLEAFHDMKWSDDFRYMMWKEAVEPDWDSMAKREYLAEMSDMTKRAEWNMLPPRDYLDMIGPDALDKEMKALDQVLGRHFGLIDDLPADVPPVPPPHPNAAPAPHGPTRKYAVLALKQPLVIDEDKIARQAAGLRGPGTTTPGGIDVMAEAQEQAEAVLRMLEEPWRRDIEGILTSPKLDRADPRLREVLTEMGLDPTGMTEQMMRIALEDRSSLIARLKTIFLQEQGYDGVVLIRNGRQKVVVFESGFLTGDRAPIWQISENAPFVSPSMGFYHRRMTSGVHEMIGGRRVGEPRRPAEWEAHFARQTKDMTFLEASEHIRSQLRHMGFDVADDFPVLEADAAINLNAYVDGMTNELGNVFLGREARKIKALGLGRSPFVPEFIGPRYEGVPSAAYLNTGRWLSKQSEKLWSLAQKAGRHQTKVVRENQKVMERLNQTIASLNERMHAAVEDETQKTIRAMLGMDRGDIGDEIVARRLAEVETLPQLRTAIRQLAAEGGVTARGEARIRARMASYLEPENLRPSIFKQLKNREAELEALRRQSDWKLNVMRDVAEEWNRIRFMAEARVAEPKVAVTVGDPGHIGMTQLQIPGLKKMWMPAPIADEFNYAARGFKQLNEFQKVWRRFLSWWKEWATWSWPGFHIRNMMGGWFNNWLGGVQFSDYVEALRAMKARREIELGLEPKWSRTRLSPEFIKKHNLHDYYFGFNPTYADLAELFSNNGINAATSRTFGEARIGAELLDKQMQKPASSPWTIVDNITRRPTVAGVPGRKAAKFLRGWGENTENLLRGAAFLQGVKQYDGDFMAAHSFTMMRHGDYADLSDWEYGLVRDLVPFYKWMRTNTPLQIHMLFERPAKLMAVLHAKENLFEVAGVDFEEARSKMPEWALEGLVIPTPGSTDEAINLVIADLPMNDLYFGAGEFFSQMLPLVRPMIESYVTEKSMFTGAPIEGKPVKIPWIPRFMGQMLSGLGLGEVGKDGSYFIPDKLQNVMGAVPIISRFRNWVYEEPSRVKLRTASLVSATFGIGLREFTNEEFRNEELAFYYDQVLPQLDYLKKMGYPLPTMDDLEAAYGSTNNVLSAAGINPRGGL